MRMRSMRLYLESSHYILILSWFQGGKMFSLISILFWFRDCSGFYSNDSDSDWWSKKIEHFFFLMFDSLLHHYHELERTELNFHHCLNVENCKLLRNDYHYCYHLMLDYFHHRFWTWTINRELQSSGILMKI